jgi:hypothetical protein
MLSIGMGDPLRLVFNDRRQTAEITAGNSQQKPANERSCRYRAARVSNTQIGLLAVFLSK